MNDPWWWRAAGAPWKLLRDRLSGAPAVPRPRGRLVAILAPAAGLLCAWLVAAAIADRQAALHLKRQEEGRLELLGAAAEGLQRQLLVTLEWTELVQDLATDLWQAMQLPGQPETGRIAEHLRRVASNSEIPIDRIALIDAEGRRIWSSLGDLPPGNFADREHFRVHRDGRRDPFVSRPLVSRTTGEPSVNVTRPLLDAAGRFAGIVVVGLDPAQLARQLAGPQPAANAAAKLLHAEGVVLAHTLVGGALGRELPAPQRALMARHPDAAARLASPLTGEKVLLAWRTLPGYPLLVGIAKPVAGLEAEAAALRRRVLFGTLALLAVLAAGGLAVAAHLTRRRAARSAEQAEASRRRIERVLDSLPAAAYQGIAERDGSFRRRYANAAIARITGRPIESLQEPGSITALMDEAGRAGRAAFNRAVLETGEQVAEYGLRHADGRWLRIREACRRIRWLPDGSAEVVGLLSDVTAEREMQEKAAAASRLATLGEMSASVAHELAQPNAVIAIAADLAAMELDRGDPAGRAAARARLEEIALQATRARDVIGQLRNMGRADAGDACPAGAVAVPVAQAVDGALVLSRPALRAAGVTLDRRVPADLPPVRARQVALEQAILNLVVNARDAVAAMPEDRRAVEVAAWHDAAAGEVAIAVRDTGPGIPPAIAGRVLEPFFTTKPPGQGTGLGLALVDRTVRAFGGRVVLGARPGGGAEVVLRLPVAASG